MNQMLSKSQIRTANNVNRILQICKAVDFLGPEEGAELIQTAIKLINKTPHAALIECEDYFANIYSDGKSALLDNVYGEILGDLRGCPKLSALQIELIEGWASIGVELSRAFLMATYRVEEATRLEKEFVILQIRKLLCSRDTNDEKILSDSDVSELV